MVEPSQGAGRRLAVTSLRPACLPTAPHCGLRAPWDPNCLPDGPHLPSPGMLSPPCLVLLRCPWRSPGTPTTAHPEVSHTDLCPYHTIPAWSLFPQGTQEGHHQSWVPPGWAPCRCTPTPSHSTTANGTSPTPVPKGLFGDLLPNRALGLRPQQPKVHPGPSWARRFGSRTSPSQHVRVQADGGGGCEVGAVGSVPPALPVAGQASSPADFWLPPQHGVAGPSAALTAM